MTRLAALLLVLTAVVLPRPAVAADPQQSTWAPPPAPALIPTGLTPADCTAPASGEVGCFAVHGPHLTPEQVEHVGRRAAAETPATSAGSYAPSDLRSMYGVPASASSTRTIGIVDVGASVNTQAVMDYYRTYFHLPSCDAGCFTEVDQRGGSQLPYDAADLASWVPEIDLDLEAVSAVCPTCHILLVDADSASTSDMNAAVQTAKTAGADVISMSWGSALADDPVGTPPDQASDAGAAVYASGPVLVAATGDNGYHALSGRRCTVGSSDYDQCAEYPAAFPGVVAAGGTSVVPSGSGWATTGWSGAGSGCTADPKPARQASVPCGGRAVSDVSALADPNTGLLVFIDNGDGTEFAASYGGTSLASPVIASLYALEGGSFAGPEAAAEAPYATASLSGLLTDVTSGASTGSCATAAWCRPGPGWDGPTGIGTPAALGLFSASVGALSPAGGVDLVAQVGSAVHETPLSIIGADAGWSAQGLPAGLRIDATTGEITGTPTSAGHSSVVITNGSASETISVDVYDRLTLAGGAIDATAGTAVSVHAVGVSGGSGRQDWYANGLPSWLTLDPATGTFMGTPGTADLGSRTVTVTAYDHADTDLVAQTTVTVSVRAAPVTAVATRVHLKPGRLHHARRARVRVSVLGGSPVGRVVVYDRSRRIGAAAVSPLNHASLRVLIGRLTKGRHRLRVVFVPSSTTLLASSTALSVRVR